MVSLPKFVSEKGVDMVLHVATEFGSEIFAEMAADYILGRRSKEEPLRKQFFDLLKTKDKDGIKDMIKANQLGVGLGDEQIMENDTVAAVLGGLIETPDQALALNEFFYSSEGSETPKEHCLTKSERSTYRKAHILETNEHVRRRNLAYIAKLSDHAARRNHVGQSGKLDPPLQDQAWDYLTKENDEDKVEIENLDKEIAKEKAKFQGKKSVRRPVARRAKLTFFERVKILFGAA